MPFTEQLTAQFPDIDFQASQFRDNHRVVVPAERLLEVLGFLKNSAGTDMLFELTAVDYLNYEGATDRFGVIYGLLNCSTGERLLLKTFVNDPEPTLPTATGLWRSANWMEREVYDMYGVRFAGHPDPRRVLLPDEFEAFPLRKDYPVKGRGERHNFPVITRANS